MKSQILLIAFLASILFIGCSEFKSVSDETYAQTHSSYYYDANIYIDYDFDCAFCYYEMYWCYNCQTYHVHINHWCHNHYYWYNNWYVVYYYQPYAYYHGHYTNHYYYRDVTRHYVRDNNGLRNYRVGRIDKIYRTTNENRIDKNDNIIKQRDTKKYNSNLKKRYDETYKKQNEVKRENKTYQKQNNTQKQNTQKPPVQKNSGSKTMKKR